MTGLDKIIARLETDAQAEIDAVRADADAQRAAILEEYRQKADAEYAARLAVGKRDAAQREERLGGAADMEARRRMLAFKQEMVTEVFSAAAEKLVSLPKDEYIAFLAAQAAKAAATGTEELVFNAHDAKELGREVAKAANALLGPKGHLTVSDETREISGGVIVRQGDIEANCAVETLVRLRRGELAAQVAELLFA